MGGIVSRGTDLDEQDSFTPLSEDDDSQEKIYDVATEADAVDGFSVDKGRKFELKHLEAKLQTTTTVKDDDEDSASSQEYRVFHGARHVVPDMRDKLVGNVMTSTIRDQDTWTPLQLAALHGHAEAARFLLEGGVDPDVETLEGSFSTLSCSCHGITRACRCATRSKGSGGSNARTREPGHFSVSCSIDAPRQGQLASWQVNWHMARLLSDFYRRVKTRT